MGWGSSAVTAGRFMEDSRDEKPGWNEENKQGNAV